jgi:hypothetical protein
LLSTKELRDLFVIDSALRESRPDPSFEIGLPLQVENDTNIIAFANGWTNDQLIEVASSLYGSDKTLVRRHPGGLRNYPDIRAENDQSANSIEFIQRCARIATVNSSVGLESLLFDRQTFHPRRQTHARSLPLIGLTRKEPHSRLLIACPH